MIFAELQYPRHYDEMHEPLVRLLSSRFEGVESGHQGDSWIWVTFDEGKVAVDTFTSMTHQVKAEKRSASLAAEVIGVLRREYRVKVYDPPELDLNDDDDEDVE